MSRHHRVRGFTLVELLVVITIIGILMGMLVPAVAYVRERARIMDCASRVRQLALAMNGYCSQHNVYPMNWGYTDRVDERTTGQSWISMVLPQLDRMDLYQMIKFGANLSYNATTGRDKGKDNLTVASTKLPLVKCPTDTGEGLSTSQQLLNGQEVATTNYKAVCGSNWHVGPDGGEGYTQSNRGRNAFVYKEGLGRDQGNGLMPRGGNESTTNINYMMYYPTSDAAISDGMSHTFAVGETVPAWTGYAAWYWWDGAVGTCGLLLNLNRTGDANGREMDAAEYKYSYGFFSRHAAGANFAFCDGHVQFITESLSPTIYQALATISGREVFEMPE